MQARFAADFVHFAVEVERVRNDTAAAGWRQILDQAFGFQRIERGLELGQTLDRLHAGARPRSSPTVCEPRSNSSAITASSTLSTPSHS